MMLLVVALMKSLGSRHHAKYVSSVYATLFSPSSFRFLVMPLLQQLQIRQIVNRALRPQPPARVSVCVKHRC